MTNQQKKVDTLSEIYLLETAFAKEGQLLVMHDDGNLLCDEVAVRTYQLLCKHNGQMTRLDKIACILCVPVAKLEYLKSHIKSSQKVRALTLRGTQRIADRHPTASVIGIEQDNLYRFELRNGTLFDGILAAKHRYHLLVRVGGKGGKIVLVYKHAIYTIKETASGGNAP